MLIRKSGRAGGVTLAEVLVASFVLSLFLLTLYMMTKGGIQAYEKGMEQTELKSEAKVAVERITSDFRQAIDVTYPWPSIGNAQKYDRLYFRRYNTSGVLTAIDYSLNAATGQLTRREAISNRTYVVAENLYIASDPNTDPNSSYFAWTDPADPSMSSIDIKLVFKSDKIKLSWNPTQTDPRDKYTEYLEVATAVEKRTEVNPTPGVLVPGQPFAKMPDPVNLPSDLGTIKTLPGKSVLEY